VAARIEGACHTMKARLLVSEAALALAPLPAGVLTEDAGTVELRGRSGSVRLHRVISTSGS
jgi:class 3 adenylate cyclase